MNSDGQAAGRGEGNAAEAVAREQFETLYPRKRQLVEDVMRNYPLRVTAMR